MFAAVVAGLRRDVVRMVVILSSSALLVALVPGPAVANPSGVAVSKKSARAVPVVLAPDVVSAQVAARAQGVRVEVEDLRDEFSSTWVNPDGSLTTDAHGGQIRFRDVAGEWADVDLTAKASSDGSVGVVSHPLGLSLAGKSRGAVVRDVAFDPKSRAGKKEGKGVSAKSSRLKVKDGRRSNAVTDLVAVSPGPDSAVVVSWPGLLPVPSVNGSMTRFEGAAVGTDVVVSNLRSGFRFDVQVTDERGRASALGVPLPSVTDDQGGEDESGGVARAGMKDPVWEFGLATAGLSPKAAKDGSIEFLDADGKVVSVLTAPAAWDGEVDPRSLEPVNRVPVEMSLVGEGADLRVRLSVDRGWFAAKDRVFPITIDPTYASASVNAIRDTEVSKKYPGTSYFSSSDLRVGTYNGGADKLRVFMNFGLANFKNKQIQTAKLSVYEYHAWSCTAKPLRVYSAGLLDANTTWSNQPSVISLLKTVTVAKGYSSSCKDGRVTADITSHVKAWSTGSATYGGIALLAGDESDNFGWKRFRSSETSDDPYISFTYNQPPNKPNAPTVKDGYSYAPPGGSTAVYVADTTPELRSLSSDPDQNKYKLTFEVHSSKTVTSGTKLGECTSALTVSEAP